MSVVGEFLITFAVEELLTKVGSISIDEITRILGMKKDLKKLSESAKRIQAFLQEAEVKQATDDRVNPWLMKLQDVIYSADDVLDDFSYEIQRRKFEIGDQVKRNICSYLVCGYNPVSFRREIANKVKEINKTLTKIEKQAISELALKAVVGVGSRSVAINQRDQMGTHSLLDESELPVGRRKELKNIISFMEEKSSSHDLKLVCVVGFGGLGKTTLAKMVVDEAKRENLFDVTMWIDVSKTSSATTMLGEMLQKVDDSLSVNTNIDTILERLRSKLKEKTFLLVVDNVWSKEDTDWLNLEKSLSLISKRSGNSVIMTTRITELASVMGTSCRCLVELQELSDDECWSIIKGKVFGKGEESTVLEDFQRIGVDIAKKCRGVPLVANVVGGLLHSKRDTNDWVSLRDSNVWQDVKENNILPVLRLSFDNLPSHLKQCFAYCSLFRKNFVFEKDKLIQLWMAEGFLHPAVENASTSKSSMEEIGDKYFDELWANSFFQNVEVDKWGNILRCKMHDLIHDLAMSVSNKCQQDGSSSHTFTTHDCRWMSIFVDDEDHPSVDDYVRDELRKLRSLHSNRAVFLTWFDFDSLRSLNLYGASYDELPATIGALKHLRYLDISGNFSIQELPESITKLYNLQTLRVTGCWGLRELPRKIGNLVSLRHIHIDFVKLMPFKVGYLTNLQTLPLFAVGQEEGCKIQELELLNELRGKLKIFNLQHVRNGSAAVAANLKGKKLSKLRLMWREDSLSSRDCNHQEVLEGLQPTGSILSLTIEGYMGKLFPEWMCMTVSCNGGSRSSLNQLAKLKLLSCKKCETVPTLGHLPRLKILEIERMEKVRRIGCEFYGQSKGNEKLFPVLEKLILCKMRSLEEWEAPDDINHAIPCLQELVIDECSLLKRIPLSHIFSLKSLKIGSCPKLISLSIGSTSLEDLSIGRCAKLESISSSQDLVSLKHIWIDRCPKLTSFPIGSTSLEDLSIDTCDELESISSSKELVSLKCMDIYYCPKLTSLPEGLPSIEELEIRYCEKLESISSLQHPASLKILEIKSCPKLTLCSEGSKLLKHLRIDYISNLSADAFGGLSSLELLDIASIGNMELMPSVEDLTSLQTLWIQLCGNLTSLPVGLHSLKCLQELKIYWCHKITALSPDIKSCTSLKHLSVFYCRGLMSIETDIISSLTQLETLKLGPFSDELVEFPGFDEISTVNNPSLKELRLNGRDKIKSLPYLGHLTALKELEIRYFGISELPIWLAKLSSLENLTIWGCQSLISLPAGMQQLSKLTSLDIDGSPLLTKVIKEDRSAFWPNISHIANIKMDDEVIQHLGS